MLEGPLHRTDPRRLRIVHCVRAPIGGIFRNVLDLAAAQSAAGHQVGIVLDSMTGGEFEADKIAKAAPGLALGITRLPMPRMVNPLDLLTAWRVFRTVSGLAPDILHGHGAKGGTFARLVGSALSTVQKPVARFYSPHGGTLHYARNSLAGRTFFTIERALERYCDGIIHVSRYEANTYLDKIGTPRCRASVVVNGLRPEEFVDVEANAEAADLLFMGMMRDLKGIDLLIRAIALVRDRTGRAPTANLLGEGQDRPAYERLVQTLGLADAVRFHTSKPTREGLAMGKVMVVPSRAESMPYIVLESIAAGIPLIATRVGGIPEIMAAASDRLVEPGNVEAMATAIEAALRDPQEAHTQAMAARRILRERFTIGHMAASVESLYFRGLARRRGLKEVGAASNLQTAD